MWAHNNIETTEYYKSRQIAKDIENASAAQIGQTLGEMCDSVHDGVEVERWGYTNGTSWEITVNTEN